MEVGWALKKKGEEWRSALQERGAEHTSFLAEEHSGQVTSLVDLADLEEGLTDRSINDSGFSSTSFPTEGEVLGQHRSVFFDPTKGLWECRHCDWTHQLISPCRNVDFPNYQRCGQVTMEAPFDMGFLLGKLGMLLAPQGCRLPSRVKDRMHLLKEDVEDLSEYLAEMAEAEDLPLTAKRWMKEARELAYDIEDNMDMCLRPAIKTTRFICKIGRVKIPKRLFSKRVLPRGLKQIAYTAQVPAEHGGKTRSVCKAIRVVINCLPRRLRWYKHIMELISDFRVYIQEAIERHERYELHCYSTFRRRFVSAGCTLPTPYGGIANMVIDGRVSEFIDSLDNDRDQQLKVVSVLGSGCLGKTALAQVLYNKFAGQFDCTAFIQVSKRPDVVRLFRDMLTQVQGQQPTEDSKELDLASSIRKHLQDKRYLIIIDDIWTASTWDIISHAFPKRNRGSRVITTTQMEEVALTCCCYHSKHIFEMRPLDHDHSRKLFFNILFGSESDCPKELKEVTNKIVELCGGLPLATISIASLLSSQPVIKMDLLAYLCDSLSSCLWTSPSEGTRQVLNLSYNNLPRYLKICLLCLSMYPKGHTMWKDDLVKQWVAEGFIHTTGVQDMEKVAASYFDELIKRRFIQPLCIKYNNEVSSCTIHDVVHDLIADKSKEENFNVVIDSSRKNVALSHKVRRLSLLFGDAKYAKTPENMRRSQVRSLTFFGLFESMPSISEFKLLRVLSLQLSGYGGRGTINLTGISDLFQLRYLKIASDICIQLPEHMLGLHCLETLVMDSEATAVPWDIIHLPSLSHLSLLVMTNLLHWLGSMRFVGKLNNLRDLHLTFSVPSSDYLKRSIEALGSLLSGHGNLKTLALVNGLCHRNTVVRGASKVTVSWDGLVPPPLLEVFDWSLRSCILSRIPKWIGKLGELHILKIAARELAMDGIDALRGLPALTDLSLYLQTAAVERIVFDKGGFSVLNYFKLRCSVPCLKFEANSMPNLQKLKLGFNAPRPLIDQHGASTAISIGHLPCLREIYAKIGGACADAESALATAISNHPSNPRISVQLVDYTFDGDEITHDKNEQDEVVEEDRVGYLKKLLMSCARAVDEKDSLAIDMTVPELGENVSVSGKPLQRLGEYMVEGLVARLASSGHSIYRALKWQKPHGSEMISYQRELYAVCPYLKFGYVSANGAIAEAVRGEDMIHIIDFRISQGVQWISLIQALAARPGGPPTVRITCIDDSESAYVRGGGLEILGNTLSDIAREFGLPFEFHALDISVSGVEEGHLGVIPGEAVAVNFNLTLHQIPDESVSAANHRDRILRLVKQLSPKVVTIVEQELNTNTGPFTQRFAETLDYYTAIFESIDVERPREPKERTKMEQHCLARKIVNIVACEGAERVERHEVFSKWNARLTMAGFRPLPLGSRVKDNLRTLLHYYSSNYRLAERDGVIYLGWKNRALVVSSAWH
ncbi:disease resistance protein RGA5-like [Triticum dicoccoides]|uniref:disease resistance protein RGA5-like n=1 Tax=Triticum dicoccoides TaxID=85692 RepID=UPI000E7BAC19|nr:disease resistance protein RGA5-like [Triticum dicoccoides]